MGLCLCHKWLTQTLPSALFQSSSNQWLELRSWYLLAFVISKILFLLGLFKLNNSSCCVLKQGRMRVWHARVMSLAAVPKQIYTVLRISHDSSLFCPSKWLHSHNSELFNYYITYGDEKLADPYWLCKMVNLDHLSYFKGWIQVWALDCHHKLLEKLFKCSSSPTSSP